MTDADPLAETQTPANDVLSLRFDQKESAKPEVSYGPYDPTQLFAEDSPWGEVALMLQDPTLNLAQYRPGSGLNGGFPFWEYVLANAAAWTTLGGVLKSWINRRAGRKVILYSSNGKKALEVTGDMTAAEIESLLRARVAPPELGGPPVGEDES
jgi:hypothetical protein